ncbi:transcription factor RAX2-like [Camellia sinensis]|uniref:Transcription factor RAX2 n=1 Tax=Camellia sinensis var. sinensis TaxID=542762 RepID=A0A4S4DPZ2_CAMSN|nr:transcription factor RAX2-like [Camellia sinensis]THG05158.1 hypothetical protein TEA_019587 [Camellia sinensis var. sinensis]
MGRAPCCDKANVKKGPWSPEEDSKLKEFIEKYGTGGNWIALPQKAGLKRCGKSCRLRWLNYLRPNIKHGEFSEEEDRIICTLFASIGSRWSIIAAQLPGRTDNDIKNYWNTKLKKKLMGMVMVPPNHRKPPPYPPPPPPHSQFPPPPPPPPPPLYRDCTSYYNNNNNPARSFTALEPTSIPPPNLINNNYNPSLSANYCLLQTQESLFSPMQYYPPLKESFQLVFVGDQASCSSSDGSCSQISHGKEIKQEDMGFQSYMSNGFEENHKFMLDYGNNNNPNNGGDQNLISSTCTWIDEKPNVNGYFGNTPLEYDLEEVKKLISTDNECNNNNNNSFFFNDENKTQERTMDYYY